MDSNLKKEIEKQAEIHAIHNAVKFKGKANEKAVFGNIIKTFSEHKKDIKQIKELVNKVVIRINKMSLEDQETLAKDLPSPEKKEKREGLKELPNVKKTFITRFEPSPSGPLHLGHAIGLLVNFLYAKKYNGKLILRISDTNPDNIYPEAYQMIEEDAKWLCKEDVDIKIQSDRMELYYSYAEEMIRNGWAYCCSCDPEKFKASISKKKSCKCRELSPEENIERWEEMLSNAPAGKYVVRIKTDVKHKNPAMRDWPAIRINTTEHVKQLGKYRVWPLLNFAVAVDDHEMNLTHVIRGKDHADNTKRQLYIYNYYKWNHPEFIHWGRINFKGMNVSSTETKKQVESGEVTGWDDIRIPFIRALRRRGFQPEAFHKYAIANGVTLNDKTVTKDEFFKTLNAFNRDIIESSNRYFFVEDPVEIDIDNAPELDIKLKLHPDFPNKGFREIKTTNKFYITKDDHKKIKNHQIVRLMDCLNFHKDKEKFLFDNAEYAYFKKHGTQIIHWLPAEDVVNIEILMPDHTIKRGVGELNLFQLNQGDIIQFERFGFCKLDKIEKNVLKFWFTHK